MEPISFDVAPDGYSFSNLAFKINGSCTPGGYISLGDVPITVSSFFPINPDGSFSGTASGTGITFTTSGSDTKAGTASGTFRVDLVLPYGGITFHCTSGNTTFTAQAGA